MLGQLYCSHLCKAQVAPPFPCLHLLPRCEAQAIRWLCVSINIGIVDKIDMSASYTNQSNANIVTNE